MKVRDKYRRSLLNLYLAVRMFFSNWKLSYLMFHMFYCFLGIEVLYFLIHSLYQKLYLNALALLALFLIWCYWGISTIFEDYEKKGIFNREMYKLYTIYCHRVKQMDRKEGITMADALNAALLPGDKINVFDGATQIDGTGSFISASNHVLIWVDATGNYRIQNLGGAVNVQKV